MHFLVVLTVYKYEPNPEDRMILGLVESDDFRTACVKLRIDPATENRRGYMMVPPPLRRFVPERYTGGIQVVPVETFHNCLELTEYCEASCYYCEQPEEPDNTEPVMQFFPSPRKGKRRRNGSRPLPTIAI